MDVPTAIGDEAQTPGRHKPMETVLRSLTEKELSLFRDVEAAARAAPDEDALIALHTRVRRARDKHVKVYRRQAAAQVDAAGGRGMARPRNTRNRAKAEVFEKALATVSRQLAAAAETSAEAFEAERLSEEKQAGNRAAPAPRVTRLSPQRTDRKPDSPDLRKRRASTRAAGARRQARKDGR